jgi:hypothetical protein
MNEPRRNPRQWWGRERLEWLSDPRMFQNQFRPAFWTIASAISLALNIVLIVAVLAMVDQMFRIKDLVQNQLVGGLYQNFVLMDQAKIQTTIPIDTEVRANFDIPLHIQTTARLTQDTRITGARIMSLSTGGMTISDAPIDIMLPQGTNLPIELDVKVPVNQPIPIKMDIPISIPLNQTDLHAPFVGLQNVVLPYYRLLNELPSSWNEYLCGKDPGTVCNWLVP